MTSSPPLTPIRDYMSPIMTSPPSSYRQHLSRRTSSFSSNHDRSSPVSTRSKHRYSCASIYSNASHQQADDFAESNGNGMGTLADELDMLDDEDEEYDDAEVEEDGAENLLPTPSKDDSADGTRDSGIDVSYPQKRTPQSRNFSKPFSKHEKPPDSAGKDDVEERFTPELEDSLAAVHRMAQYGAATEDPLIPRVVGHLQNLGNQSTLESLIQRMNTSANSIASHLTKETRTLQLLSTSLYSPFLYANSLDFDALEEATPLVDTLLTSLPYPDSGAHTGLQKLDRETTSTISTLAQITDTLQMGRQCTNLAARHLRSSQAVVEDMRRERENAEAAQEKLVDSGWHEKFAAKWCKSECDDVLSGFEETCAALRESLVVTVEAGG
ncbi:hypothetical protein B0A48_02164 [Cryoendolithus antarcticus]|uniref:Uncharacterized protein n=1 Tax=Cryoendolithus antarcticus TaxID=1507870 RepID=A0A1V8TN68_9PEZI|nr:hypothetical protein B0A48_02164 [Cryoendolithus antarcticus]